jgi:hypothetical protein
MREIVQQYKQCTHLVYRAACTSVQVQCHTPAQSAWCCLS